MGSYLDVDILLAEMYNMIKPEAWNTKLQDVEDDVYLEQCYE